MPSFLPLEDQLHCFIGQDLFRCENKRDYARAYREIHTGIHRESEILSEMLESCGAFLLMRGPNTAEETRSDR